MVQLLTYLLNYGIYLQKITNQILSQFSTMEILNQIPFRFSNFYWIWTPLFTRDGKISLKRFEQRWKAAIFCKKTTILHTFQLSSHLTEIPAHKPSNWNLACISAFLKPLSFLGLAKVTKMSTLFIKKWKI